MVPIAMNCPHCKFNCYTEIVGVAKPCPIRFVQNNVSFGFDLLDNNGVAHKRVVSFFHMKKTNIYDVLLRRDNTLDVGAILLELDYLPPLEALAARIEKLLLLK